MQLRLTVQYDSGEQIDHVLYQHIPTFDTSVLKEMITQGEIKIERVTSLYVVLEIRPPADKAVQARVDDNKRVLRSFFKMLERAETYIAKVMDNANPLQIRIGVTNSYSARPEKGKL